MAKHFTAEFKLEAAKLVVDHGYTFVKATEALRDPHKSALINHHHILVGSGEVFKNGTQHRSF